MATLLEKAKEADKRTIHKITPEIIELATAWAKDEVSITQARKVLKVDENNKVYSILARALKEKIKEADKTKIETPIPMALCQCGKVISTKEQAEEHKNHGQKPIDTAPSKY